MNFTKIIKTSNLLIIFFIMGNLYAYANRLGSPSKYTDGRLLITAGYHDNLSGTKENKGITVIGFSNGEVKYISSINSTTTNSNWNSLGFVGSDLVKPCVKQITISKPGDVVVAYAGYDTKGNLLRKLSYFSYGKGSPLSLNTVGLPNEDVLALLPGDATYFFEAVFKSGVYGYSSSTGNWVKLITLPSGEYIYSVSDEGDTGGFVYSTTANKIYYSAIGRNWTNEAADWPSGINFPINSLTYIDPIGSTDGKAIIAASGKLYYSRLNSAWGIWTTWVAIPNPRGVNNMNGDVYLMKNGDLIFTGMPSMYLWQNISSNWSILDSGISQQENQTIYDAGVNSTYTARAGIDIAETGVYYAIDSGASTPWSKVYTIDNTITNNK